MKSVLFALAFSSAVMADEPPSQRQQELRNLLQHDCGSCHGLTRQGGLGPSLLADDLANKSDTFLVNVIQNGLVGTAMPPWKRFITEQETIWLVQKLLRAAGN